MAAAFPRAYALPLRRPRSLAWPWTHVAEGSRDLRLDLLRGFCVFAMIVDHAGGASYAHAVSGAGEFFVSAAEGFVFLSGFVMGMVYGGIVAKEGLQAGMKKALLRSWTLYKLTVALTLIFGLQLFIYHYDFGPFESWPRWIADVVTLRQTIYLGDVPLIYALLMASGAFGLWLLASGRTAWLLGGSGALWLAYQLTPDWANNLPWPVANNTMFHFPAWQLYFVAAMALGYHRQVITRWWGRLPKGPLFLAATAMFGLMLYLHLTGGSQLPDYFQRDDVRERLDGWFQKGGAGPLRLVVALVTFQFAALFVTYFWQPIQRFFGWLLLPLGQNSLYAYAMHVLLIGALYAAFDELVDRPEWPNTIAQLGLLVLVWCMVKTRFLFRIVPR
ncbi:MAG TPA: OpgC domain-containing protein [Chloroflexota bacterium]|nr:OpgC domain-containing protein [Chloroflexota bacterium]